MSEEDFKKEQRRAIFHGACGIALGLLSGIPYTLIILRDYHKEWSSAEQLALTVRPENAFLWSMAKNFVGTERAWKMAHLEGILNGMVCLIFASIFPSLSLSINDLRSLTNSLAITVYGNSIASIIAATYGVRGFVLAGSPSNATTCSLFMAAIYGVCRALQLTIKGTF